MHRVFGLHYKDFLPIAIAAFIFSTGMYGVFAGLAALIVGEIPSSAYALAILALSGGGLMLVLGMALPYQALPLVGSWFDRFFSGWARLWRSRFRFSQWLAVVVLLAILEVALFYSIIRILGLELSVAQTAIIVLAKENSMFLRLTPGAFGVAEGVQVFFAAQFGVDAAPILLAAVIARAIELLTLTSLSLALARRLTRQLEGRSHQGKHSNSGAIQP